MKKKLEQEVIGVAQRIINLKDFSDVNAMHAEVAVLYEKLSALKYLEENYDDIQSTIANDASFFGMLDSAFNNKVSDSLEINDSVYIKEEQNQIHEEEEDIVEPLMEKIKDIVAQMPQEADAVDDLFEAITPKQHYEKNDFEDITADFKETPVFEPVANSSLTNIKRSLNDKLKSGGLNIGLNDKLAFIKQLFEGSSEDYHRVIAQINTSSDFDEARHLIQNVVKTEYNNWEGKEVFEDRFMQIIEARFN